MSFLAVHGLEAMLSWTRVVCIGQQFTPAREFGGEGGGEPSKTGKLWGEVAGRISAARADGGAGCARLGRTPGGWQRS